MRPHPWTLILPLGLLWLGCSSDGGSGGAGGSTQLGGGGAGLGAGGAGAQSTGGTTNTGGTSSGGTSSGGTTSTGGTAGAGNGGGAAGGGGTGGTPPLCGGYSQQCCAGGSCDTGLSCVNGTCTQVASSETGKDCTKNSDCSSGICLPVGGKNVCTTTCASAGSCVAGWTCGPILGQSSNVCQCGVKAETCNGSDDDCDGIVDNKSVVDAQCFQQGPQYQCLSGACTCTTQCAGKCVDLNTDKANCGACGVACSSVGGYCSSGKCACSGGTSMCSGSCVSLLSDPSNCGSCGVVCPSGAQCNAGKCAVCAGVVCNPPNICCSCPGTNVWKCSPGPGCGKCPA